MRVEPESCRATALGRKSYFLMTASTGSRFWSLTLALPVSTRETVAGETPASRAIS
jgi:hypothetical protein